MPVADAWIFGVKRLAVAECHRRQIPAVWWKHRERALGQRQRGQLVEGILRIDEVLIVHPDLFLANPEVVVDVLADAAVEGDKRLDKRQRQIVAGHWLEVALIIDVFQVQIARRISAEVDSRQQRQPGTNALDVQWPRRRIRCAIRSAGSGRRQNSSAA